MRLESTVFSPIIKIWLDIHLSFLFFSWKSSKKRKMRRSQFKLLTDSLFWPSFLPQLFPKTQPGVPCQISQRLWHSSRSSFSSVNLATISRRRQPEFIISHLYLCKWWDFWIWILSYNSENYIMQCCNIKILKKNL